MSKESIDTLVSELTHEEEWRRMRATAACLAGGPRAVQALTQALESGDVALRVEAAAMLSRIKDPAAGLSLVGLLRDSEETVRQAAFQRWNKWPAIWMMRQPRVWCAISTSLRMRMCETGFVSSWV